MPFGPPPGAPGASGSNGGGPFSPPPTVTIPGGSGGGKGQMFASGFSNNFQFATPQQMTGSGGTQFMAQPVLGGNGQQVMSPGGNPIFVMGTDGTFPGDGASGGTFPGGGAFNPTTPPPGTNWTQGQNGGWVPPAEFNPPSWWTPPADWTFGQELPKGTSPWEQLFSGSIAMPFGPPPGAPGASGGSGSGPGAGGGVSSPPSTSVPNGGIGGNAPTPPSNFPGALQFGQQGQGMNSQGVSVPAWPALDNNGNNVTGPSGKPIMVTPDG
ncbi:MAG: hypothetical protein ABIB93_04030 [Chloroflexota bacterium]